MNCEVQYGTTVEFGVKYDKFWSILEFYEGYDEIKNYTGRNSNFMSAGENSNFMSRIVTGEIRIL